MNEQVDEYIQELRDSRQRYLDSGNSVALFQFDCMIRGALHSQKKYAENLSLQELHDWYIGSAVNCRNEGDPLKAYELAFNAGGVAGVADALGVELEYHSELGDWKWVNEGNLAWQVEAGKG